VQRAWLKDVISASDAPVLLVASGSVVLGAPSRVNKPTDDPPYTGYCSGDDWDCYRPAQQNLLATLSTARGCVIILTGDYHSADIKRLDPLETAPYSGPYLSKVVLRPWCPACAVSTESLSSDEM
jgi:alkaline phosphatase D